MIYLAANQQTNNAVQINILFKNKFMHNFCIDAFTILNVVMPFRQTRTLSDKCVSTGNGEFSRLILPSVNHGNPPSAIRKTRKRAFECHLDATRTVDEVLLQVNDSVIVAVTSNNLLFINSNDFTKLFRKCLGCGMCLIRPTASPIVNRPFEF